MNRHVATILIESVGWILVGFEKKRKKQKLNVVYFLVGIFSPHSFEISISVLEWEIRSCQILLVSRKFTKMNSE